MHLVQRQPEKLVVNVETSVHKASLPEKINYCAERPSAHAYTDNLLIDIEITGCTLSQ